MTDWASFAVNYWFAEIFFYSLIPYDWLGWVRGGQISTRWIQYFICSPRSGRISGEKHLLLWIQVITVWITYRRELSGSRIVENPRCGRISGEKHLLLWIQVITVWITYRRELLIEIGSRWHVLVIRCCGVQINKINLIMLHTYLVDPFIQVKIHIDLVWDPLLAPQ